MKVKGWVATNKVGSKSIFDVEIDDGDFEEDMTQDDRDDLIDQLVFEQLTDHIEWGWTK